MDRRIVVGIVLVLAVAAGVGAPRWLGADKPREVTTSSDKAYAAYEAGMNALGRFRLADADTEFQRAVEIDPDFAMAYVRRAQVALTTDDRDHAKELLQSAYDKREGTTELERLWIERTHAALNGDKEEANRIYEQLVERYGDHPWVLRLRAEYAKMRGDDAEALACYSRILEADPEAVDVHNLQGYLYLSMGEYEKAVQSLQRYAFYAPDQANPHDSLGEAFLYTGRYEEAVREFVAALEIDPGFVWSAVHLADVLGVLGQFQRAHEILDKFEPLFQERNWDEWLALSRMRNDMRAEDWNALLAEAQTHLADREDEEKHSEFGLWLHYALVISYLELGDLENARAALPELAAATDQFVEERSENSRIEDVARLNRAFVLARFGRAENDPARGVDELRAAIAESRLSPHELSTFRYELAEDLLAAGRPEEVIEVTQPHLEIIPTSPMMNLVTAQAYAELGRRDEAIEHLQVYLEVMRSADEGHPYVAEATRLLQRLVPRS